MSLYKSNLVDIRVILRRKTPNGWSVESKETKTIAWLPSELTEMYREPHWPRHEYEATLPRPLAARKGLVQPVNPGSRIAERKLQ